MLAESKAMGADGLWAVEEDLLGDLDPKKEETSVWMEAAYADFSRCFFQVQRALVRRFHETDHLRRIHRACHGLYPSF
jgi:hypothetical protein